MHPHKLHTFHEAYPSRSLIFTIFQQHLPYQQVIPFLKRTFCYQNLCRKRVLSPGGRALIFISLLGLLNPRKMRRQLLGVLRCRFVCTNSNYPMVFRYQWVTFFVCLPCAFVALSCNLLREQVRILNFCWCIESGLPHITSGFMWAIILACSAQGIVDARG